VIKLMADWGERQFVRDVTTKLDDAGHIVNNDSLPGSWVQPFRAQVATIRRTGGSEQKLDRVGKKARRHCLHNLESLIQFFKDKNVTDGEGTRQMILTSLQKKQAWVDTAAWQDLLTCEVDRAKSD
jgi:hypothetical protein